MAFTRLRTTKDGRDYYEIRVSMGRGRAELSSRWYVPEGWSKKVIDRELTKVAAEFERKCKAGEILTKAQEKEKRRNEEQERAKIKTVQQYAEQVYFPRKKIVVSRKTLANDKWTFKKYIFPVLGELLMEEVTPAQITALLLGIQAKGLAHSSVVRIYAVLGTFFKAAYLDDTISKNPMDKVLRPKPRKEEIKKEEPEAYSEEELRYILECLKKEPLKWRVYISLLIETGIRRGECCGLQWSDINWKTGEILISGSLGSTTEDGIYRDTTKNRQNRTVNVPPTAIELLRQLRIEQAQKAISIWVFTQDGTTKPMHPDTPDSHMSRFGKKYGIDHLHPHKLRHTFASIAITNGADVVSISEILGHTDTAITLRTYSHASKESRKRASDIFLSAISANK